MRRSWQIWVAFGTCLAVLLAAMGWISLKALRLEQAEVEARQLEIRARRQAALEQDVRLALYRMDDVLKPLVARESARPYFVYDTFLALDRWRYGDTVKTTERLAASPLLTEDLPHVRVHFQVDPDGRFTSPRAPEPAKRHLVVPKHVSSEAVEEVRAELARLAEIVDRDRLVAMLPEHSPEPVQLVVHSLAQAPQPQIAHAQPGRDSQRQARNYPEYDRRSRAVLQNTLNLMAQSQELNPFADVGLTSTDLGGIPMTPLWIEDHLFLARRVSENRAEYIQGCLLDWPVIRSALLSAIEDLFPAADLRPVADVPEGGAPDLLAALPVRLIPGERPNETVSGSAAVGRLSGEEPPVATQGGLSPIRLSLVVAWGCVLMAAAAVAALLAGVIRLSERRASFVSAVTHELRTPLTTFHMYTEMLAEGMVSDEEHRRAYLSTLRSEASRLSHLVENVLSYARLERGRADGRIEEVPLGQLLKPIERRLADRARRDGMEMVLEADDAALGAVVRVNPSAVEQILLNLVDNAGKYANDAPDKRIHLILQQTDGAVQVRVRDHGPGVSPAAARRLFHPFSKSAKEAANSAPGVGLGLALSRRLARDMGGRLWLDTAVTDGACFVLALPTLLTKPGR